MGDDDRTHRELDIRGFEKSIEALIVARGVLLSTRKAAYRELHLDGKTHRIAPNRQVLVISHK